MSLVNVSQLIDKTLYTKGKTNVRAFPQYKGPGAGKILTQLKPGDMAGTVYSWVYGKDENGKANTDVWLELYEDHGRGYGKHSYILWNPNLFDTKALKEQGVLTVKQEAEAKANENKSFTDKLLDKLPVIGLMIGLVYLGGKKIQAGSK